MTKRIKNKTRPSRAYCGAPLWGNPNDPANDRKYPPGQHGINIIGMGKKSEYALQLIEKQKLRFYHYITEKQFKNTFVKASKRKGNTGRNLIQALESRLDAVVYRAKFGASIFASRQLVSHGHITVNGKRVKIPSYSVKPGDVVAVRDASKKLDCILQSIESPARNVPDYIHADHKKLESTYIRVPEDQGEVPYPVKIDVQRIVEFYSR